MIRVLDICLEELYKSPTRVSVVMVIPELCMLHIIIYNNNFVKNMEEIS